MDYSRESGAESPEDETEGGVSQVPKPCIGSGKMHPNAEQIGTELNRMMRSPFRRMLADYLGFAPTPDALRKFADKSPDRWIQGAVMLAQLSGYQKEVHVSAEVNVNVGVMSDAEIQKRLNETRAKLGGIAQARSLPPPSHTSVPKRMQMYTTAPNAAPNPDLSALKPDDAQDVPYHDLPSRDNPT